MSANECSDNYRYKESGGNSTACKIRVKRSSSSWSGKTMHWHENSLEDWCVCVIPIWMHSVRTAFECNEWKELAMQTMTISRECGKTCIIHVLNNYKKNYCSSCTVMFVILWEISAVKYGCCHRQWETARPPYLMYLNNNNNNNNSITVICGHAGRKYSQVYSE